MSVIQSNQPLGQSFTPSLSSVGFIRLFLIDGVRNNGLGATVYVNLREDAITGPVLGLSGPVFMPDNFGIGSGGYTNFFFSSPVPVTPGATYYLQPVVQSGDTWEVVEYNYSYPGGTLFLNGAAVPFDDLWFREGVFVPEPSWALLILVGGGIVGKCRYGRAVRATVFHREIGAPMRRTPDSFSGLALRAPLGADSEKHSCEHGY